MKKLKIGLLGKILIAIALGIGPGGSGSDDRTLYRHEQLQYGMQGNR